MEAVRLKQFDMDYRNHLQAYLGFAVKATKKQGKKEVPIYKKFVNFFDYKAKLREAMGADINQNSRFSGIGKFLKKGG